MREECIFEAFWHYFLSKVRLKNILWYTYLSHIIVFLLASSFIYGLLYALQIEIFTLKKVQRYPAEFFSCESFHPIVISCWPKKYPNRSFLLHRKFPSFEAWYENFFLLYLISELQSRLDERACRQNEI